MYNGMILSRNVGFSHDGWLLLVSSRDDMVHRRNIKTKWDLSLQSKEAFLFVQ
jgi:hypothetical protein